MWRTTGTRVERSIEVRDEHLLRFSKDLDLALNHWENRSVWSLYSSKTKKPLAMEHIIGYLNKDADEFPDADTFVLQWSGHGARHTGDWCLDEGGRITLDDVMGVWVNSRANAR